MPMAIGRTRRVHSDRHNHLAAAAEVGQAQREQTDAGGGQGCSVRWPYVVGDSN